VCLLINVTIHHVRKIITMSVSPKHLINAVQGNCVNVALIIRRRQLQIVLERVLEKPNVQTLVDTAFISAAVSVESPPRVPLMLKYVVQLLARRVMTPQNVSIIVALVVFLGLIYQDLLVGSKSNNKETHKLKFVCVILRDKFREKLFLLTPVKI